MDVGTVILILQAVVQLAESIPEIVTAINEVIACLKAGTAPTPEQQAQIDALLEAAHAKLQSA